MPCIRPISDLRDNSAEIIDDKLMEAEVQARETTERCNHNQVMEKARQLLVKR